MSRTLRLTDLSDADRHLIEVARDASVRAYAPYSGFAVGAAVRTKAGQVYSAANLENASYGLSICAEVSVIAVANAVDDFDVETIAVVGHKFTKPQDKSQVVTPCGRCRQLIYEASQVSKVDVRVLSCNGDLSQIVESPISELLPAAFGPANLGMDEAWPKMRAELLASISPLSSEPRKPTPLPERPSAVFESPIRER